MTLSDIEKDLKQQVILVILLFVLSLSKMAYSRVSNIAGKKELHTQLEEIKQLSSHGLTLLRSGSVANLTSVDTSTKH